MTNEQKPTSTGSVEREAAEPAYLVVHDAPFSSEYGQQQADAVALTRSMPTFCPLTK